MISKKVKFIYYTASTVNGFLSDEKDDLSWLFNVKGRHPNISKFIKSVKLMVMGANTYKWLIRTEDLINKPDKWKSFFGDIPVYVFSNFNLQKPESAKIIFAKGDVRKYIGKISSFVKSGTVWIQGGGDIAGQFYDCGVLDEIHLTIAPVFLKSGKPQLPRNILSDKLKLKGIVKSGNFINLLYRIKYS
jgi:dihydrofolate reductase